MGRRALRGCTRVDLPPVEWDVDVGQVRAYMGRPFDPDDPVFDVVGPDGRRFPVDPDHPPEEPRDGCPGGWYRTPYVDSVLVYLRTRAENGARNQNHYLDATTDRRVLDAVYYVEREQERVFAYRAERLAEEMRKARKG